MSLILSELQASNRIGESELKIIFKQQETGRAWVESVSIKNGTSAIEVAGIFEQLVENIWLAENAK